MQVPFQLDPRLAGDTVFIGDLALSRVLLMKDARYAWIILVPARAGAVEIVDLSEADAATLMQEIRITSDVLRTVHPHDKLNIGALGNVVRQLHVHVVARVAGDAAGAGPVWGHGQPQPYEAAGLDRRVAALRAAFGFAAA